MITLMLINLEKINKLQASINLDKAINNYCYFFLSLLLYQLFYYYYFYPSLLANQFFQLGLLTKKLPLVIGVIYLAIFHVVGKKQWWITIPISLLFLTFTLDAIVTGKMNYLFAGKLSGKTALMTSLMFMCPILMSLATAFLGMCVWRQKDYD